MIGDSMRNHLRFKIVSKYFLALIVLILIFLLSVSPASSHGPKGHGGVEFTPLQAAKKGIALYDKLVASGKLTETWEMDLMNIEVYSRQNGGKKELVVKFNCSKGEPQSVYIFFTEKGEYSGSNFSGK
jgi:hypothetical protein